MVSAAILAPRFAQAVKRRCHRQRRHRQPVYLVTGAGGVQRRRPASISATVNGAQERLAEATTAGPGRDDRHRSIAAPTPRFGIEVATATEGIVTRFVVTATTLITGGGAWRVSIPHTRVVVQFEGHHWGVKPLSVTGHGRGQASLARRGVAQARILALRLATRRARLTGLPKCQQEVASTVPGKTVGPVPAARTRISEPPPPPAPVVPRTSFTTSRLMNFTNRPPSACTTS